MDLKKFLEAILGKMLNMDAAGVAALLNDADGTIKDSAVDDILKMDIARVEAIKKPLVELGTANYDRGFKTAEAQVMEKFEKELMTKYNLKSDKKGAELIEELKAGFEKATGKKGEITEDDVKRHAAYIALQGELEKKVAEKETEWKTKWGERDAAEKSQKLEAKARALAVKIFKESGAIVSSDPVKAERQQDLFVNAFLADNDFMSEGEGDDATIILLDKTTKQRKKDAHDKLVKFEDTFKENIAASFDIEEVDPKKTPGLPKNKNGQGAGAKAYAALKLKSPTNADEFTSGVKAIRESQLSADDKLKAQLDFSADFDLAKAGKS